MNNLIVGGAFELLEKKFMLIFQFSLSGLLSAFLILHT